MAIANNQNSANKQIPSAATLMRDAFAEWLKTGNVKKYSAEIILSSMDRVSEYAIKNKLSSESLWGYKNHNVFKPLYTKLLDIKLLRITEHNTHKVFIIAGQLYLRFLKQKPWEMVVTENSTDSDATNEVLSAVKKESFAHTPTKTIKYAVIQILRSNQRPMTAKEIYEQILERNLYTFGAQNPVNVVRNILDSACDNSGYSDKYKAMMPAFHFEKNDAGKRVYSLLKTKPPVKIDAPIAPTSNFGVTFSGWLKNVEKMADGTCHSYVSALNKAEAYAREHNLPSTSISGVDAEEALSTVSFLMADEGFRQINQNQHSRFSAAFQKLAKYFGYIHSGAISKTSTPAIGISENAKAVADPKFDTIPAELTDELSVFLKESDNGISKEDILAHFSTYSIQQVKRALLACHAVKVLKKYYHKENISDYSEMADVLLDVLTKQFAANGNYTSAQQLYNDVHFRLDDFFFYNNAFESRPEVYDLAVHLFSQEKYKGNSFLFVNGMHIWKEEPNYPKDFHGLLIKYGREHQNVFTREQALAFLESIGSATPDQSFSNVLFNSGSKSFLQYAENCFILKEALHVNDNFLSALSVQIENLLEDEAYIAFGEINDYFYTTLPDMPANIQWSPLLLEDMLRIFDIGYITVEAGNDNDKKTIPAAILKKNSQFKTFSDLVWNEISKAYLLPKELTASEFREFLLDNGFIRGSEKMWNVHKTVAGDLRFYWTEKNSKVTIH